MDCLLTIEWRPDTEGYKLSNENVTVQSDGEPAGILYSRYSSYICGHSVMIKINKAGKMSPDEGLGLAVSDSNTTDPLQKGVFFVSSQGN